MYIKKSYLKELSPYIFGMIVMMFIAFIWLLFVEVNVLASILISIIDGLIYFMNSMIPIIKDISKYNHLIEDGKVYYGDIVRVEKNPIVKVRITFHEAYELQITTKIKYINENKEEKEIDVVFKGGRIKNLDESQKVCILVDKKDENNYYASLNHAGIYSKYENKPYIVRDLEKIASFFVILSFVMYIIYGFQSL